MYQLAASFNLFELVKIFQNHINDIPRELAQLVVLRPLNSRVVEINVLALIVHVLQEVFIADLRLFNYAYYVFENFNCQFHIQYLLLNQDVREQTKTVHAANELGCGLVGLARTPKRGHRQLQAHIELFSVVLQAVQKTPKQPGL